jgi:hypothetical protein
LFLFAKTDLSKPVKQEVNGTVILTPLVFPVWGLAFEFRYNIESATIVLKARLYIIKLLHL